MTENLKVFFFELTNPDFAPGRKVTFLPKFAGIPGSFLQQFVQVVLIENNHMIK
jgi:hypothetical protein